MRKLPKLKKVGFTLLEVIVVIIILAILASIAVPRYTRALERSRAAEGTYFLGTLLSSMERYFLENGDFPADGVLDVSTGLDIDPPALKYFDSTNIKLFNACASGSTCAVAGRLTGNYTLEIDRDGTITCQPSGSQECSDAGY